MILISSPITQAPFVTVHFNKYRPYFAGAEPKFNTPVGELAFVREAVEPAGEESIDHKPLWPPGTGFGVAPKVRVLASQRN